MGWSLFQTREGADNPTSFVAPRDVGRRTRRAGRPWLSEPISLPPWAGFLGVDFGRPPWTVPAAAWPPWLAWTWPWPCAWRRLWPWASPGGIFWRPASPRHGLTRSLFGLDSDPPGDRLIVTIDLADGTVTIVVNDLLGFALGAGRKGQWQAVGLADAIDRHLASLGVDGHGFADLGSAFR